MGRNRRREKIPKANEVFQAASEPPKPVASSLEEIKGRLKLIEETLSSITQELES
jgi:hypothetical protein